MGQVNGTRENGRRERDSLKVGAWLLCEAFAHSLSPHRSTIGPEVRQRMPQSVAQTESV